MVALKGKAIARFVAKPDAATRFALVYGPDTGLVSERARLLAKALAELHGGDVEPFDATTQEPGALYDAATSLSLFGGQQIIHLRGASNPLTAVLEAVIEQSAAAPVVAEAADLKPSASLRKLAEARDDTVALPCYADSSADLSALIDEMLRETGQRIEPEAREALGALIGGDRLASRGEIDKLRDYCAGQEVITLADVTTICGDASTLLLDEAIDAVALGDAATADSILQRAIAAGTPVQAVLAALGRHFEQLRTARVAVENGATAEAAMRTLRPPVFFKRQGAFKRQLTGWRLPTIERALNHILASDSAARRNQHLQGELASRLILTLARGARARG